MSHAATRMKGDESVNYILDCRVERESDWTRKSSVTVRAEEVYAECLNQNTVGGIIPEGERWDKQRVEVMGEIKEAVKTQF